MVRSMICHFNLLESFWWKALKTATYILNKVSTEAIAKIPYELWIGKNLILKHLYLWECPVETRPYKPNEKKLDSMKLNCYFIGYFEWPR